MDDFEKRRGISLAYRVLSREFRLQMLRESKAPQVILSHDKKLLEEAQTAFQQWRDRVNCPETEREDIFILARDRHLIEAAHNIVDWEKQGRA